MPETFLISSFLAKGPRCVRKATMASALAGPIPGSASSSLAEAVFMFNGKREVFEPVPDPELPPGNEPDPEPGLDPELEPDPEP